MSSSSAPNASAVPQPISGLGQLNDGGDPGALERGPILAGYGIPLGPSLSPRGRHHSAVLLEPPGERCRAERLDNLPMGSHASENEHKMCLVQAQNVVRPRRGVTPTFPRMKVGGRIAQARQARGWSQAKLATVINTAQTTISSWERSRTEPTREDVVRIAAALDIPSVQLELDISARAGAETPVVGYVGAGAEAHFYADSDILDYVLAPEGSTATTRAAEIKGDSLGPLFERWLIFYDDVRSPVTTDLLGKLCIVGLPDGRVLVKQIQASRTPDLYHLLSNFEQPFFDQEVMWAAAVKDMRPR